MRMILTVVAAAGLLTIAAGDAAAYPQFQLSTSAERCSQCHFSPGGGGLLNAYGRDEAGSTISWIDDGALGDGRLLHGAWTPPDWLALGGDYRGVVGYKDPGPGDADTLLFPMQADLYVRPTFGPISITLIGGMRGVARGAEAKDIGIADRLTSREHFVTYEPDSGAWYVRAGRFFPVYGLRSQDHTSYVRRYLGLSTLEEPYGAAYGKYGADWELHVSAFTKPPSASLGIGQDTGAAVYYEKRNEDVTAAYGAQARVTASSTDRRALVGGVYKRWLEDQKLMVLAELDAGAQAFPDTTADARLQLLGYLGVTYMARQGVMIGGVVQGWDDDLLLEQSSRAAAELDVQVFPFAHFEAHLLVRGETAGLDLDQPGLLGMLQLHYYL
ncbi:MAG: hypothetical protein H6708_31870 [Kofleriaceae bacterium]|nr:hypothetical protein [Kofleriaceae bacterium]